MIVHKDPAAENTWHIEALMEFTVETDTEEDARDSVQALVDYAEGLVSHRSIETNVTEMFLTTNPCAEVPSSW